MTAAPNIAAARAFLQRFDAEADFVTVQTFDDTGAKRGALAKIAHIDPANGALDSLAGLNDHGAGVYFTVNATDGKGRQAHNVQRVRAVFLDLDGAPLAPVLAAGLEPHIVVESSPGKFHVYWQTDDCPLDQFERVQRALARRFGGDPSVHDLPRVLRVPGFLHRKGEPFLSHVVEGVGFNGPPYALAEIVAALGLELDAPAQERQRPTPDAAGKVAPGDRHAHLFRLGRSMARKGLSREAVGAALAAENEARCDPPLGVADVDYLTGRSFTARDAQGWQDAPPRDDRGADDTTPHQGASNATAADPVDYPEPRDLWQEATPGPLLDVARALPPALAGIVEPVAESRGHDVGALALSIVCALSACLRQRSRISAHPMLRTWTEGSALWGALIGESGTGKSPSMQFALSPLTAIEKANFAEAQEAGDADGAPAAAARVVVRDVTVEALGKLYVGTERRLLNHRDEGTGFVNGMGRYSGRPDAERGDWCSAWNCQPHSLDRKTSGSQWHEDWGVALLIGLTPSQMKEAAEEARQDGLIARMLPVIVRPPSGNPRPSAAAELAEADYAALARSMYGLGVLTAWPSDEAAAMLDAARKQFAEAAGVMGSHNRQMAVWLKKAAANALRVALVFAAAQAARARIGKHSGVDFAPIVDDGTADQALRFVNWSACHALAFSELNADSAVLDLARRVALFALARNAEAITRRDLARYVSAWAGQDDERIRSGAILHLFDAGWIVGTIGERVMRGPRLADATGWAINPRALQRFADYGSNEIARRREVRARMLAMGGADA